MSSQLTVYLRTENCEAAWYGTAPFCAGSCPDDWVEVKHSNNRPEDFLRPANWCGDSTADKQITCQNSYGVSCIFGGKSLCEKCSQ